MIRVFQEVVQGSDEWFDARRGLLTASEMKLIITPKKLEYAQNDKERAHLYELAAQCVTKFTEPTYISDDMMRGMDDESYAREEYHENHAEVTTIGFMTNDKWGFTIGYSPDGLVGDDGQIEVKSRRQKYQMETIVTMKMPEDFLIQVQTGLLVSERQWCDFISYCGGMHMVTIRVYPDPRVQAAIVDAATAFHSKLDSLLKGYEAAIAEPSLALLPTVRRIQQEITL